MAADKLVWVHFQIRDSKRRRLIAKASAQADLSKKNWWRGYLKRVLESQA